MRTILNSFLYAIKAKLVKVWTLIKLWSNPDFIKNRVLLKIKEFFSKLLNVKPRDKDDYYTLFGWMVSKKLAFAVVIFFGIISILYILLVKPLNIGGSGGGSSVTTYKYNSIPLKYHTGQVKILGKSGYKAYVGQVKKGVVQGEGKLYSKKGNLVYEGQFENNMYNGTGKRYYDDEILWYSGEFKDNEFNGQGTLYRENGVEEYNGEFLAGKKNGKGELYNSSGNLIYTGEFRNDLLLYTELLGKNTKEIMDMYSGNKVLYQNDEEFGMELSEIDAMFYGESGEDKREQEYTSAGVYVLSNNLVFLDEKYANIFDLKQYFGEPLYEGNTFVNMMEAACINKLAESGRTNFEPVKIKSDSSIEDVVNVKSIDKKYSVYVYTFEDNGLLYTFYCRDRNSTFDFYCIEAAGDSQSGDEQST